ncbi:MAG: hypothetical protein ACRDSR_19990, partial [Pseudonocardiaceae bacterium]
MTSSRYEFSFWEMVGMSEIWPRRIPRRLVCYGVRWDVASVGWCCDGLGRVERDGLRRTWGGLRDWWGGLSRVV